MKKIGYIISILFSLYTGAAQTTNRPWEYLRSSQSGQFSNANLNRIQFVSSDEAFAVGVGGTLLRLSHNGTNWTCTELSISVNIPTGESSRKSGYNWSNNHRSAFKTVNIIITGVSFPPGQTNANTRVGYLSAELIDKREMNDRGKDISVDNNGVAENAVRGGVFKTTDNGTTWFALKMPYISTNNTSSSDQHWWSPSYIHSVNFSDVDHGVAVGEPTGPDKRSYIYKTSDGGNTWTRDEVWASSSYDNNGNAKSDIDNCSLCPTSYICQPLVTTIRDIVLVPSSSTVMAYIVGDNFLDERERHCREDDNHNNYCAIKYDYEPTLVRTDNVNTTTSGGTWRRQNMTGLSSKFSFRRISFNATGTFGLIAGNASRFLAKTTDGGTTWSSSDIETSDKLRPGFNSVHVVRSPSLAGLAFAVGDYGVIAKTTNSGATWTVQYTPERVKLEDAAFSDNGQRGIIVGMYGSIFTTTDYGSTWQIATISSAKSLVRNTLTDVYAHSATEITAVGGKGTIIQATRSGNTATSWNLTKVASSAGNEMLTSVSFNGDKGFIAGRRGILLRSFNKGISWDQGSVSVTANSISTVCKNDLQAAVWLSSSSIGIAVDDKGFIYRSTDGGANWSNSSVTQSRNTTSNVNYSFLAVAFNANNTTGLIVGSKRIAIGNSYRISEPVIMRSTDQGITWQEEQTAFSITSLNNIQIASVKFQHNSNINVVIGGTAHGPVVPGSTVTQPVGFFSRSTDAGSTWILTHISQYLINKVDYTTNNIYACGNDGAVFRFSPSVNQPQVDTLNSNTVWPIHGISAFAGTSSASNEFAAVAGHIGMLMYTSQSGGTTHKIGENDREIFITSTVGQLPALEGIFPNPTSETATISYRLTGPGIVTIKLFDLMGSELKTLTDGFENAGRHSLIFDGLGLASGMYMVRLEANGQVISRSIIFEK